MRGATLPLMWRCLTALALVGGALGCRARVPPPQPVSDTPSTESPPAVSPLVPAPHRDSIWGVELDSAGEAAITRDGEGDVRFWPRLVGDPIPLAVPIHGVESLDIIRTTDGWRLLTAGDDTVTVFSASRKHLEPRKVASVPGREGRLIANERVVVIEGQALVTYDIEGRRLGADEWTGELAALLTSADRTSVVLVTGTWRDSLELGWDQGTAYAEEGWGRFDGVATRYARVEGHAFQSSGRVEIHALEEPSASTFAMNPDGTQLGFMASLGEVIPEEADAFLIDQVDFLSESTSRPEEGQEPDWWKCSDNDRGECSAVSRPRLANRNRAKWAKNTVVLPAVRWLVVARDETKHALGASPFLPQSGTWSPDGTRIAFAVNDGDDQDPRGRVFITEGPLDGERPPSLRAVDLGSEWGLAELLWVGADTLLQVGLDAQLDARRISDGTSLEVQFLGEQPDGYEFERIEHNRAAGLMLIYDDYEPTLVSWSEDGPVVAGPIVFADGVNVDRVGVLDGEGPGIWMLGPQGLATASLEDVRRGPLRPRFTPLSGEPRAVFDVSWDRDGARIIDWGDRWEVSVEGRNSEWLRDVPVFGPLLRTADGSKVLTRPDCGDRVVSVHPASASALEPDMSWTQAVPDHAKFRWSLDGSRLLVLGVHDTEHPAAQVIDVQTREVIAQFRDLPYEVVPLDDDDNSPPEPRPITGRCRSNWDLHQELFPGDA